MLDRHRKRTVSVGLGALRGVDILALQPTYGQEHHLAVEQMGAMLAGPDAASRRGAATYHEPPGRLLGDSLLEDGARVGELPADRHRLVMQAIRVLPHTEAQCSQFS